MLDSSAHECHSQGMRTKARPGFFIFYSEDRTKIALLADSQVPMDVKEFLFSISNWVEMAKRNSDLIKEAVESDDDGGSAEGCH